MTEVDDGGSSQHKSLTIFAMIATIQVGGIHNGHHECLATRTDEKVD
jgi:hypothetical protein